MGFNVVFVGHAKFCRGNDAVSLCQYLFISLVVLQLPMAFHFPIWSQAGRWHISELESLHFLLCMACFLGNIASVCRDTAENGNKKRSNRWDTANDNDYPLLRPDVQLAASVPLGWGKLKLTHSK